MPIQTLNSKKLFRYSIYVLKTKRKKRETERAKRRNGFVFVKSFDFLTG